MDRKRRKLHKWTGLLLSAALLTLVGAQTALAASTITSVSITLDIDVTAGEPLPDLSYGYSDDHGDEVTIPSNTKYDIKEVKWTGKVDEAKLGNSYTLYVYLGALNDYSFKGSYSSSNIRVKGGSYVTAKRVSSDELRVTVKTKPTKGTYDSPDDAYWLDTNSRSRFGQARWERAEGTDTYDAYLYRGSKIVFKATKIHGTSYNFYPYMTQKGTYTFRVRAVPSGTESSKYADESEWTRSDEVYLDENDVSDGKGQSGAGSDPAENVTDTTQVGWVKSGSIWYFRYPDGTYQRDSWLKVGDHWYLFDSSGIMLTGWQSRNGRTYYLEPSGQMHKGWLQYENHWYYLNPLADSGVEGAMATGWLSLGGKNYYLDENGVMAEGWKEVEDLWFYFYPGDGQKAVDTYVGMFYLNHDGIWNKPQQSDR